MDTLKIFLLSLFLLLVSCHSNENSSSSEWDLKEFRNGDIIYRHGNGFFSDYFRKSSNREKLYSHGGIIAIDNNSEVYVIHAEASELTGVGGVRKESLNVFLKDISTWAVYRLDTTQTVRDSIVYVATQYLNKETPFDLDFDNTSDDKVYCTELIALSINKSTHRNLIKATGSIRNKPYFAIDDTYLIKEMKPIIRKP
ncbi:hypothetical protein G7051_01110 [Dysgonomonas sp. HDW5B]|uniref:YiiX/YebB-like N1pC/P60 family cysteine hydrolase n=1 Tax=Dysgonomonas sp. HDW5B TaxID=2714927 RepID=UPI00140DB669|nr:YiiX/YebB-like N1pC/P60 family cysteine hydrolase [Dysgonomonas sp. HDW5B]QIK53022.1 hypothetical protein G7051_01110 [Dysgonomonas sp. HDW5B]